MEDFDEFVGLGEEGRKGVRGKVLLQGDDLEPHPGFGEFFQRHVHFAGEVPAGFGDAGFGSIGRNGGGGPEQLAADVGGSRFGRQGFANGYRVRGKGGDAGFKVEIWSWGKKEKVHGDSGEGPSFGVWRKLWDIIERLFGKICGQEISSVHKYQMSTNINEKTSGGGRPAPGPGLRRWCQRRGGCLRRRPGEGSRPCLAGRDFGAQEQQVASPPRLGPSSRTVLPKKCLQLPIDQL